MNAKYFIEKLGLQKHVEGGYFKQTFVSSEEVNGNRKLYSSIYFLLKKGEVSNFHVLTADEMWYFHGGSALTIYMIDEDGALIEKKLGLDIEKGEEPQVLVPKGYIFGSSMNNDGFSLVGCMVAPQFTFEDFRLFKREELLSAYPKHKEIILKLTRD